MFSLTKTLTSRLVPIASSQVCSVRQKGTVPIMTIAPQPAVTEFTIGPYPRTKEERERAARKYNLIPEDYEPYDEEEGFGDYPKLPAIGAFNRDKYDDFDEPYNWRFYGEPFHLDCDLYTYERIDPLEHKKVPPLKPFWVKLAWFSGAALFLPTLSWLLNEFKININHPYKVRRPYEGPSYKFPPSVNDNPHHHH